MNYSTITKEQLKNLSVVELKQQRAEVHKLLVEGDGVSDKDEAVRKAVEGLHSDLDAINREIRRKDGQANDEAARARREHDGANVETTSAILRPDQSVRSYMHDSGLIRQQEFEELRFGQIIRAMVTGPKNDLERRALAEGSDSAGGYTVPDITLARFIDKMRAATVTIQAGAQTVPLTSDKTVIARTATDPAATWRDENAAVTVADSTYEAVTFVPRSLAVIVKVSRELLEDSLNIEQMLEASFAGSMAVELDRVALIGSGTPPEPKGISTTTNVNSVAGGGALTSYDKLLDALYENWLDNEPITTAAVMHPRTFLTFAKLKAATTNEPLPRPPAIVDLPFLQTTSLSITEAPGTASRIIAGNFARLMIGVRTALRVEVLRELYAGNHQYGFVAHLRADIGLEHPASFTMVTGVTP